MFFWIGFFCLIPAFISSAQGTISLSQLYELLPLDKQSEQLINIDNGSTASSNPLTYEMVKEDRRRVKDPWEIKQLSEIKEIRTIPISGFEKPIQIRIYTPFTKDKEALPVFIYFHGGGWVFGSLEDSDLFCQQIAIESQCIVVSVDYHLAPEYPFPIPFEDCYLASKWVSENAGYFNGDATRLIIGGSSAGGNLAAAVTLKARDEKTVLFMQQVLIYPVINANVETLSYFLFGKGYGLSRQHMSFFWDAYLQGKNGSHPYASPLKAGSLKGLPPAWIVVAEYDPLRDEALSYGWRMQKEGSMALIKKYPSVHGFIECENLVIGQKARQEMTTYLRHLFKSTERIAKR